MIESKHVYAWDDLILTGVLLVTRRWAPAAQCDELMLHPRGVGGDGRGCKLEVPLVWVRTRPVSERQGGRPITGSTS
jgi:hypothetical protein